MRQWILLLVMILAVPVLADTPVSNEQAFLRLGKHESGWLNWADHVAVMQVLHARKERLKAPPGHDRLLWAMKSYARRTFRPEEVTSLPFRKRNERQGWLNHLDPSCEEPPGFEKIERAVWVRPHKLTDNQRQCRLMLRNVRMLLSEDLPNWCMGPVDHWGSPKPSLPDRGRALRAGWTQIYCNPTRPQVEAFKARYERRFGVEIPSWVKWWTVNEFWCDPRISACPEYPAVEW